MILVLRRCIDRLEEVAKYTPISRHAYVTRDFHQFMMTTWAKLYRSHHKKSPRSFMFYPTTYELLTIVGSITNNRTFAAYFH